MKKLLHNVFHDEYSDNVVSHLYNKKDRQTNQRKRKVYVRRTSTKKSRQEFNVNNVAGNESDDTDTEDESMKLGVVLHAKKMSCFFIA